ncbi:N-formylglutamate deformylase [Aquamicrobium segne]|uniref:N-formylglutamate deformylase n=1 Tax=Aquamicrobium segne TaxID=469547 RepID=A0ABW0H0D1_9HYPH
MAAVFEVHQGTSPVILGLPHTGTYVPDDIKVRLNDNGLTLSDTDWHIEKLYDGLLDSVTTVRATFHRYCIDANRDPEGISLYPGQNTTGLIPETDFDGVAIWKEGEAPTKADIADRIARFHKPYHDALAAEIERVKSIHGVAVLYDCHSIRSHIPFLFEGKLPNFNIGTDMGKTCDARIEAAAVEITARAQGYSSILNGRFKGGWTTRHYGRPEQNIHAIQMELAQSTHLMSESLPFAYDDSKAARLRLTLKPLLQRIEQIALEMKRS